LSTTFVSFVYFIYSATLAANNKTNLTSNYFISKLSITISGNLPLSNLLFINNFLFDNSAAVVRIIEKPESDASLF
jgi:uncharacterized membrane protein YciS (DUF1049 family)